MEKSELENIQIRVTEKHGIRRFLYPLSAHFPGHSDEALVLVDADGIILPSYFLESSFDDDPLETYCLFAISLAPYETKVLRVERANGRKSVIPDPLQLSEENNELKIWQERVSYDFGEDYLLKSVVYDNVEHLAGPMRVEIEGADRPFASKKKSHYSHAGLKAWCISTSTLTQAYLTCCKSWIEIDQIPLQINAGGKIRIHVPLTITSAIQTCDFGFGNGAYAKLEAYKIDKVSARLDLADQNQPYFTISSLITGSETPRLDYQGSYSSREEALSRLWMHWNEPTKALAISIVHVPFRVTAIEISLTNLGATTVEFEFREKRDDDPFDKQLSCSVNYHFLNAIPPIAAATNPASIICVPEVICQVRHGDTFEIYESPGA